MTTRLSKATDPVSWEESRSRQQREAIRTDIDPLATAPANRHSERHPATGQFTPRASSVPEAMAADPHVAQIIAATWKQELDDWDSSSESVDQVISRARAATQRALRQAGFNTDNTVTGSGNSDPSLDPRRTADTPEPSAKVMKLDDMNARLAKILTNIKGDVAAVIEKHALDRGDVDSVLQKRLNREDRAPAAGWMGLLKSESTDPVDSVFGGCISFAPTAPIAKADSGAGDLTKRIESMEQLQERLEKSDRRPLEFSALFGDSGPVAATSYTPTKAMHNPIYSGDHEQLDSLTKTLSNRSRESVTLEKLLD